MAGVKSSLTVAALVLTLPLVHSAHIHIGHHVHNRQADSTLPSGWREIGCYTDNTASRTLTGAYYTSTTNMTVESCVDYCNSQSYIYAGVEYAQECYCGNALDNGGSSAIASDCNSPCTGNADEICGAGDFLSLYWSSAQPPAGPVTVQSVGLWESLGCYSDSTTARTLTIGVGTTGDVTVEACTTACYDNGYPLAGVEYSTQCYCGTAFENGGAPISLSSCNMACQGNSSEFCGGPNALDVYNYTGIVPTAPPGGGGGGGGGTGTGSGLVFPVTSGLPAPWTYGGCWVDNAYGRVMANELPDYDDLTVLSCIQNCTSQNYTIAGLEYSVQCFCSNNLVEGAVITADTDCGMGCGGNATEACGGPNRLSVYTSTENVTAYPVPTVLNTSLPGQWQYYGCLQEPGADRTLTYQNIWTDNNTVEACLNQCALYGYPVAGLEYGDECWCGDKSNVTDNSPGLGTASSCSMSCSGDPYHLCGGPERLTLYEWNGNIDVWATPENIGYYEFLIGGIVVPLVATIGINGKVSFVEKFGTSEFDNSTGAYELDLSLTDDFNLAWRTMHVKSDVFCSGSIVLPDRGARQLNVGGWSLESTFGVRLYTPDGSPGVNGTNDWEENYEELHLQQGRWYPSALTLSNGSVLVVGGEAGSNGAPVPTLEILPTPEGGPTWLFADYLNRTDPNNLYPFLHMLPSGRIFIGYYNEARILDPVSLQTVQVLPNMPGSVTSFLAGRTYPMEATAVLFPQYPPYTDPVTILICGGSNFGVALDNCVSIAPEAENPEWTIERMPSKRVMTCISTLPDGTFFISNGAHAGVAGFGLGSDPNLGALLYDPAQPLHQRMSILNTTIVARMYHSESTLLPDGRVLISGSDPLTPGLPEEMRIEVYYPPYLTDGRIQPSFTITENDWAYGGTYEIEVTLNEGTVDTMRVSLVAATSSTHGNAMNNRIIFPEFSCSGNTCTITAPPNAFVCPPGWHQLWVLDGPTPSHSSWVRIGGDPAELGNWPNFPDFSLPGVGPL